MSYQEITPDPVELDKNSLEIDDPSGTPSRFVCPECGGALWETSKRTLRKFQCHVGHAFSVENLLEEQAEEIEQMLWTVMRTLKDRMKMTLQMADEARNNNQIEISQQLEAQAQQARQRAELIRQALLGGVGSGE